MSKLVLFKVVLNREYEIFPTWNSEANQKTSIAKIDELKPYILKKYVIFLKRTYSCNVINFVSLIILYIYKNPEKITLNYMIDIVCNIWAYKVLYMVYIVFE